MVLEHLETYKWYLNSSNKWFRIRNNSWSICKNPKMAVCGVNEGKLMVSLKNSFKLFHNVLLLEQLADKWITVSSSWLQKEQSLVSLSLKI